MNGHTHKAFAVCTTSLVVAVGVDKNWLPPDPTALLPLATAWVTAPLPDRLEQTLSLQHRSYCHTIWFALLSTLPLVLLHYVAIPYHNLLWLLALGIPLGILSHHLGDAFSTAGVRWFYPLTDYIRKPNGAFFISGKRILPPLYKVGSPDSKWGALLWYVLTGILWVGLWRL